MRQNVREHAVSLPFSFGIYPLTSFDTPHNLSPTPPMRLQTYIYH